MKRKPKKPEDPRRRIVAAAAEVFAARGFDGARIEEIAERARINKALLYYHVGDKERLYFAVLAGCLADVTAGPAQRLAGPRGRRPGRARPEGHRRARRRPVCRPADRRRLLSTDAGGA